MEKLIPFTLNDLAKITDHRIGEVKFGEKMIIVPTNADTAAYLPKCKAEYVLIGVPEDIGIRANFGRPGAASAWESAIRSIANIQHNRFGKGGRLLVLGQIDVHDEMREAEGLHYSNAEDRKKLNSLVEKIDKEVSHFITLIIRAGKTPIIIGGGHNNAYGNIKGTALAKGRQINAINFDAHSDFRILEGRHSGNGFSYAFEEDFLRKYFIFGLHENYTSKSVLQIISKIEDRVKFNTYDEINVRKEKDFQQEMDLAYQFINDDCFGIEVDLDSIPGVGSSAMTISGFSVEELRRFIYFFGKSQNASYLHICEGAPILGDEKNPHLIGKLIGYLVTDFIKAHHRRPAKTALELASKKDNSK